MARSVPPAARQMSALVNKVAGVVSELAAAGIVTADVSISNPKSSYVELVYSPPCDALGGVMHSKYRNGDGEFTRYCRVYHGCIFVIWSRKNRG